MTVLYIRISAPYRLSYVIYNRHGQTRSFPRTISFPYYTTDLYHEAFSISYPLSSQITCCGPSYTELSRKERKVRKNHMRNEQVALYINKMKKMIEKIGRM